MTVQDEFGVSTDYCMCPTEECKFSNNTITFFVDVITSHIKKISQNVRQCRDGKL